MYKADLIKKLEEIPASEPLFLLRGRDPLAPGVVGSWCDDAAFVSVNPEKIAEARCVAGAMADYEPQKLPD